ncbi:PREDICTED: RING-H2 finger protein ATL79-like [Tarenaya hassleriana]|uniref:RING-H2 finger protein ATL79-like n=1 Tax=Tarenaya hassleriana TaxID=28532 RepID=UPI00053C9955|nr:PREDICTED: RING-H2 finger protein ATL79-like [Tarenaya hassleriana]
MRKLASLAAKNLSHLSPPINNGEPGFSNETQTCYLQSCGRWKPYSSSTEAGANASVIIIILFSFVVCAMSLGTAIRCFLRRGGSVAHSLTQQEPDQQKPETNAAASRLLEIVPTVKYSAGLKLAGAERECTICLSKFEEGEEVKVLPRCNHGFHVRCIEQWLSSHLSCPVCRSLVLIPSMVTGQAENSQATTATPGNDTADAA